DPGKEVLAKYKGFLKGMMDLRAGLSSTKDAKKVLELIQSVKTPEALEELGIKLTAVGEWAHGTHVAGLLLADLPKAELAIFRSAWAGEARLYHERGPTDEELAVERKNVEDVAKFINQHGIRVVNVSLGFSMDYVEDALRHEGDKYATAADVKARAEKIQEARRATWKHVFSSCPNTLFVVAAGNANRDILEYADTPADLDLPNVLVIGAVDENGDWAPFTNSNPERVRVFDHGVAVMSLIPSGEKVPLSGTSMAAPNAANAAAKVLSLAPNLEPAAVKALLEKTGDPIAAPFNGVIINEKKALEAAAAGAK
ncbi:MAG: S8 family serine peptidase, partial [Myxococcales bacterium]|nr:S8 family serine peptidase [Myxococcales bacterium]